MKVSVLLVVGAVAVLGAVPGNDRAGGGAPQIATSSMRHRFGLDSSPEPPGPIVVGARGIVVAGDTLVYTVSWGPGARATSYDVTRSVSASNGTWSVVADSQSGIAKNTAAAGTVPLPNTFSYTQPTLRHRMWLSAVPWDSATFSVTVISRNSVGVSAPVSATWIVRRKPGPPGPIAIDSSLIVIGMLTLPKTANIFLGMSRTFCAFQTFGNGAVTEWTASQANCDSIYTAYVPASARALVSAAQQAHTDSLSKTCVAWSTDTPLALGLSPAGSCSAAVLVTGLALSRARSELPSVRYADGPGPVLRVTPSGLATCLRPGIGFVTATMADGRILKGQVVCQARGLPTFLAQGH